MAEEDGYKPELPSAGTSIIASHASQEPTAATDEEQSAQTGPTEQAGASHEPSEAAEAAPVQVPDIQIRHASYDGDEIPREAPAGREEAAQQDTASDPPPELPEKEPPPTPASAPLPYSNGQQQSRSGRRGSLPGQVNGSAAPSGAPQHQPPRNSTVDGSRRSSVSTTHSRSSLSSLNMGSAVFVVSALEAISSAREARKDKSLKESATRALEMVRGASQGVAGGGAGQQAVDLDPRVVFEPLRLACQTRNTNLVVTSLDCIGKLVSYSFFADDDDQAGHRGVVPPTPMNAGDGEGGADREGTAAWTEGKPLADLVTETVCDCFHEGLDDRAQLQIIKALLSTVLSTTVHVHQSSLLKAVRTVYNIFLLSRNPANQAVAQGSLTQMVHHVFGRVPRGGGGMRSAESREELAQAALLSPPRRRSSAAASTVSHPAANGSQGLPTPVPEETPQVDAEAAATTPQDDGEADGATLVGSTVDNADDGSRTAAEAAKPNEQGAEAESSQQAEPEERVTL